jgi:hypothetical protein
MDSEPHKRLLDQGILAREAGFDETEVTVPDTFPPLAAEHPWDHIVAALLFTFAAIFYLIHTGPHSFWLDSAEFVTTGHGVGVAHPPGTPLYVILSAFFARLPIGAATFRLHLMNVLLGAATVSVVFRIGLLVLRRAGLSGWPSLIAAASVATAAIINPGLWFHAVRAEVYVLNVLLCLAVVWCTLLWEEHPANSRYLLLIALFGGLGLANHHLLTGLTGAVCLVYAASHAGMRRKLFSKHLLLALGLGIGGLLTYLYLPIRSADGWRMWGDAGSLAGFLDMVSARAFHLSVTDSPKAPLMSALLTIFDSWLGLVGVPLVLAGVAGLCALLVMRRREALLLLGLVLAGGLSKAIMYLDVENPDDHAYFLVGMLALSIGAVGVAAVPRWLRVQGAVVPWIGTTVLVAVALASGLLLYEANRPRCDLSQFQGPDTLNRHFHERVPPDALFMPSYYATFFNHLLFRSVEQRRPDLLMVHQSLYSNFGEGAAYASDVSEKYPETAPLFEEFMTQGTFPLKAINKIAQSREVLLENDCVAVKIDVSYLQQFTLGDGGLPISAEDLAFGGPGVLYNVPRRIGWDEGELQQQFWTSFYEDLGTVGGIHPELSKLLVWYHYRNALYFVNRRSPRRALLEVKLALQLKPDFPRLIEFESALASPPSVEKITTH